MNDIPALTIEGHVATITLRRPAQANRLEPADLDALLAHLATVDDPRLGVRVLRLQATGRHFCSGFDIARIDAARPQQFEEVANALEDARPVTLALLQGGVYGGATDLALACDFRLGAPATQMFMPAARLGLHFYPRGLERYVTRLGVDTAKRLFLLGETLDARAMKDAGFLTHLAEEGALDALADDLTATLAAMAPLALLPMKKHLNRYARHAVAVSDLLADIARAAASDDLQEGLAAWTAKRPPVFRGS